MKVNWFPGHMAKAAKDIKERLRPVDLVMEVRDARIPMSSANPQLEEMIDRKLRLLVLNKMDLANRNLERRWEDYFSQQGIPAVFVSTRQPKTIRKLLDETRGLLASAKSSADTHLMMVVGIPNVGKSALINALHRLAIADMSARDDVKTAKVGPLPGLTRNMAGFKVGDKPSAYILDTPGVMVPNVQDEDIGLRLALTGAVKDSVVGEGRLARYLLALLNSRPSVVTKLKQQTSSARGAPQRVLGDFRSARVRSAHAAAVAEVLSESLETDLLSTHPGEEEEGTERMVDREEVGTERMVDREEVGTDSSLDMEEVTGMVASASSCGDDTVELQLVALRRQFRIPVERGEEGWGLLARRLLRLYREGELGRFTVDGVPS